MTMDGTRTYIVGRVHAVVIDPGPFVDSHLDAVAAAVGDRVSASILITHAHPDHDEGAGALAERLDAAVVTVHDRQVVRTDSGDLWALATPGHTPDHFAFVLEQERAVFCGDLMMGGMDTALVARPEGNLRDYLASLERLRVLEPAVIYPAHGDPFHQPAAAIDRYVRHRQERLAQVEGALRQGAHTAEGLVDMIYGSELDIRLRTYAVSAVEAYLDYLAETGRAQLRNHEWSLV